MKDDFSKISDLIVVLEYMKKGKKKIERLSDDKTLFGCFCNNHERYVTQ